MCGVIFSDRSALEISSRGPSKLTSKFSASEIFVQRLPGSSVTSLGRRRSPEGGESCSSPSCCPCRNDAMEGTMTTATYLGHLPFCDTCSFLCVRARNKAAAWPWSSQPNHKHTKGERETWAGLSRTSSPSSGG